MKTIWHTLIPFRLRNLLPCRRCAYCGETFWGWPTWCWIRWAVPEFCSKACADAECDCVFGVSDDFPFSW